LKPCSDHSEAKYPGGAGLRQSFLTGPSLVWHKVGIVTSPSYRLPSAARPFARRAAGVPAFLALAFSIFCTVLWAAPTPAVRVWQDSKIIPTSEEGPPDPNPPFDLFTTGSFHNYPYTLRHNLVDRRVPRKWRTLNLENEYLKCTILPDLGGHLYTCLDKLTGASMFYANPSIKFARIAYRGMWAALGVEFNFPVSHNWMTVSPVDFAIRHNPDGSASVWVENIDRVYGMQWRVQLTLQPGRAYLQQRTTLYNRSDTRHRFYWWTNAGVEVWDDSRILYPMEFTAAHGFADIDTWPVNSAGVDQSLVGNQKYGPVSRFSYGSHEPYMAVYHPRTHAGVVHYSSPLDLPAKKIWSWSSDEDGLDWRLALSDNHSAYVEIQAGLFRDQETYGFLEPQESRSFTEYWIPIRDLGGVSRANPDAVLNLSRQSASADAVTLEAILNVTRELPNASISVLDGTRTVASAHASLSPHPTFRKTFPDLPAGATYTIELRDEAGEVLLRHREGKYDFVGHDQVRLGKQPSHEFPAEADRSADDFVAVGTDEESNGQLAAALGTYRGGLTRFPDSIALNRAAGRLEVILRQYGAALPHLSKALAWVSSDHEDAYYLGLALAAKGDDRNARIQWEFAQQSGNYHAPAMMALAALEARGGNRTRALSMIQEVVRNWPDLIRGGGMEVALLRTLRRTAEAKQRLLLWREKDPASSFLAYEAMRLGENDPALMAHLAGDPERIVEMASEYIHLGFYEDALDVLAGQYPSGPDVIGEPGMARPDSYPLIAYYRGFCRFALAKDGRPDFDAAARMPLTYVFPNRADSFAVLRRAIEINPQDASAHFLLGSLYLSGGETGPALQEWQIAKDLKPSIPTLHRNMGYTVLRSGDSPQRAIDLFREGLKYDRHNVDVYLGLEQALEKAGQPVSDRAQVLQSFPETQSAPAVLVFRLVRLLGEAGDFGAAEKLLENRFFPREEGGPNVRELYVQLRLKRAEWAAAHRQCPPALEIIQHLTDPVAKLPFTIKGLEPFATSDSAKQTIAGIRSTCP
jgi:tetratricopeptide (TPR) repeat protein